jgi:hypothetical protein
MLLSGHAHAVDLLGIYVGASVCDAHVRAKDDVAFVTATPGEGGYVTNESGSLNESHVAFKLMAGIRPIPLLGVEVSYFDFGRASGSFNLYPASVSENGEAVFGLLYLPVPLVDVFVKAGVASIRSDIRGTGEIICIDVCPFAPTLPFSLKHTDYSGAYGVGAQFKLGAFAIRAEYERFHAASSHPDLLSAGVTWNF